MSNSSQSESQQENSSTGEERWRRLFPYEEPYDNQADGINEIREVASEGGYAIAEAACGTGKTLMGSLAGLSLIRDSSTPYKQLLCLTSVHQQLRAFEDDIQAINANLSPSADGESSPNPVSALTLVGKTDVCSYTKAGPIDDSDIYTRCEDLRAPVRNAIGGLSKPEQKRELTKLVQNAETGDHQEPISTDEWTSPYATGFPSDGETDYCGFYARSRLDTLFSDDGYEPNGVLTPDELLKQASSAGLCPHAVMGSSIGNAEVIIANYQHIFNPRTVKAMTGALMDEETLVICDEAHSLVERVRGELGDKISYFTLDRAVNELEHEVLNQSRRSVSDTIWSTLDEQEVERSDVVAYQEFLQRIRDRLEQWSLKALEDNNSRKKGNALDHLKAGNHAELPDRVTKRLRDPETPGEVDWLTNWLTENGDRGLLEQSRSLGGAIGAAIATANERHGDYSRLETYSDSAGESFARWEACGHTRYFRQVVLEKRDDPYKGADNKINRHYRTRYRLHNCIPAADIADRFDEFGGGAFMSATLAPLEAFRETTGLRQLEQRGRPIRELTYGLPFPRENRDSLVVDLPEFTRDEAGPQKAFGSTRQKYARAVATVAQTTDGNVLVGMSSYHEAAWMAEILRGADGIEKQVLTDQSSSTATTNALKEEFFAGEPKIACTSMRGTITEGVDYSGDRLDACVICGIPLSPVGGNLPDATKAAYGQVFGKDAAFDYTFVVPALRKARQTWGRVIRGNDECGVRVAVDERYTEGGFKSVREYLPAYEDEEFQTCSLPDLESRLKSFWNQPE